MTTLADMVMSLLRLKERASAPSSPAAGFGYVYIKTDKKFYVKNSDGTEVCISDTLSNPMTTAGDIIVGGASGTPDRLAVGANTYVLTSDGTTPGWAAPSGGGASADYILVREEQSSGTNAGTFTAGAWSTRNINAEVSDVGNHCSLPGSNVIRLEAGTYTYRIQCPAIYVGRHQARLYDVTAGAIVTNGEGTTGHTDAGTSNITFSGIVGKFTIAAQNDFRVEHYCLSSRSNDGMGLACNIGIKEVYAIAEFWKIG